VKLRKQVNDYSSGATVIKNYLYIDGFVYLNDTLQYVSDEEGRISWAKKRNNTNGSTYYAFEYDYYLRDHLGNVRTVLTEGKDTATYAATMETADSATVRALFSNVYDPVRTVYAKPAAFDTDPNNHNVSKLIGTAGNTIGPSIVLKVMAGDKVQINTFAYYTGTTQMPVSDNTLLTDLLTTLVSGVTQQSGGKIGSGNATQLSNTVSPNVLSFLNKRTYNSSLPKAYLNWVLLDDQFKYVAGNMGALQVQSGSSKQALVAPLQTMAKNGYLYVYLSNQSPQNVYFDDLIVTHTTGPLLQEQSYYPFGLQMAGISDKAMIKPDSKNKFNGGVELEEDYGVNLYSTFYRQYDPQIGRFSGVDVLSEKSFTMSMYGFAGNNPVMFNDPFGDKKTLPTPQNFATVTDLIDYIGEFGLDGFSDGFYDWAVSSGGGISADPAQYYDPDFSARTGTNSKGEAGVWIDYSFVSGSFQSSGYNKAKDQTEGTMGGIVMGSKFLSFTGFATSYNDYSSKDRPNATDIGLTVNEGIDAAVTADGISRIVNGFAENPLIKEIGKVTGDISVLSNAIEAKNSFQKHDYTNAIYKGAEVVGTIAVAVLFPEGLLFWSAEMLVSDLILDAKK
jgi:RHS repeat-associated protein